MNRVVSLCVIALVLAARADAQSPTRIPVMVKSIAAADGFTDPSKDRRDSVKDLINRLKDSKVVEVVESAENAAAVLKVLDRTTKREINFLGAQNKSELAVRLTAGDYSTEFTGESKSSGIMKNYKGAATSIVKQLEAWVKANRERLAKRG